MVMVAESFSSTVRRFAMVGLAPLLHEMILMILSLRLAGVSIRHHNLLANVTRPAQPADYDQLGVGASTLVRSVSARSKSPGSSGLCLEQSGGRELF